MNDKDFVEVLTIINNEKKLQAFSIFILTNELGEIVRYSGNTRMFFHKEPVADSNPYFEEQLHPDLNDKILELKYKAEIENQVIKSKVFRFKKSESEQHFVFADCVKLQYKGKNFYAINISKVELDNNLFNPGLLDNKDIISEESLKDFSYEQIGNYIKKLVVANKDLLIAKKKAEELEQTKNIFISNLSHDIRIPLTAIVGFADLIADEQLTITERIEYTKIVKNNGDVLMRLMDDIINISLIDSGEFKIEHVPCAINIVLEELFTFYDLYKNDNNNKFVKLGLEKGVDSLGFKINTDVTRLQQVLTIFINLAFKNVEKGGIYFGYEKNHDKYLTFFIKDSGKGYSKDELADIKSCFESSTSLSLQKHPGMGMSLSISGRIVEKMGGEIWIDSVEGKGTSVFFTIPFEEVIEQEQESEPIPENQQKKGKKLWNNKTILVVEDILSNYVYIESVLKKTKANVLWAQDGNQAVEVCKANDEIDLVLMDIQLPIIDGYSATKSIKEFKPDLPIIAQTAFALSGERDKSKLAGCDDYISKPIKQRLLISILSKFLDR